MAEYGVRDLAESIVEARRWRNAVPELRAHHAAKQAALAKALGADESAARRSGLDGLLESTAERLARSASPFDDFLEAPPPVVALYQRHGEPITAAAAGLRAALTALLVEVVAEAYAIAPERTVTPEEVRRNGFDPRTPAPDPLDLW